VRLRIRRLGGLAGVTLQAQLDTAELPPGQAAEVEQAIRALAGKAPAGPPHPDGFRYEITPLEGAERAAVLVDQGEVPPAIKVLIEAVAEAGQIEPR
jgi:hypothetical protein